MGWAPPPASQLSSPAPALTPTLEPGLEAQHLPSERMPIPEKSGSFLRCTGFLWGPHAKQVPTPLPPLKSCVRTVSVHGFLHLPSYPTPATRLHHTLQQGGLNQPPTRAPLSSGTRILSQLLGQAQLIKCFSIFLNAQYHFGREGQSIRVRGCQGSRKTISALSSCHETWLRDDILGRSASHKISLRRSVSVIRTGLGSCGRGSERWGREST